MKNVKLTFISLLSILTFSCSNDNTSDVITKSEETNSIMMGRVNDRVQIINRNLIEYQAELGRCYGNPAYGQLSTAEFDVVSEEIDNQPELGVFISALQNGQFQTSLGSGININQFRVPIFTNVNAVPVPVNGPDFMYLYDVYSEEPCYINYLNKVRSIMNGEGYDW